MLYIYKRLERGRVKYTEQTIIPNVASQKFTYTYFLLTKEKLLLNTKVTNTRRCLFKKCS